ncbi:hypothetical protein SmJEL517_g01383 [Synchytrium microbalum]|uniref:ABC transporter domain-containing protein n=1 Tax=Synchytrium microbalum TaxID=1806994 RepID=A0A507CFC2_9FUNG|nr:uncharacterized protein SmJEL517_g01383 [Synchytrium microbalum]TPX36686.1 hypothetical protein SmJEL517_g01383 [Synchytrium microbalum]
MNNLNYPIFNVSDPIIPITPPGSLPGVTYNISHVNWGLAGSALGLSNGFSGGGTGALTSNTPCVYWMTPNYPKAEPYERAPSLQYSFSDHDSTFLAQPQPGWLQLTSSLLRPLFQNQLRQFFWYAYDATAVNLSDLGSRPQANLTSSLAAFALANTPYFKPASQSNGLLDTVAQSFWVDATTQSSGNYTFNGFQPVPWYTPLDNVQSVSDLDDAFATAIRSVIANLSTIDKTVLFESAPTDSEVTDFFVNVAKAISGMPYGAYLFSKLDHVNKQYKYVMQVGTDSRLIKSSGFPSRGERQFVQQAQVDSALLRMSNKAVLGNTTITQGIRMMPQYIDTGVNIQISSFLGGILFPFGVSFLLPIYVITLVKEKEDRIQIMMRMNGMKMTTYYLAHSLHFFSLHIISAAFFYLAGYFGGMQLFTRTQFVVLLIVLILWGLVQISLAFLFAAIFSKARTALVVTFLVVLCSVVVSLATNQLWSGNGSAPAAYNLYPPFAFYRALFRLNSSAWRINQIPYNLSLLKGKDDVYTAIIAMVLEIPVYLLIATYLTYVLPSEYGNRKPWYFPIIGLFSLLRSKKAEVSINEVSTVKDVVVDPEDMEDDDVKAERDRVKGGIFSPNDPLVLKGMRKVFPATKRGKAPKVAVKDAWLACEEGIILALLGPNGAGKSTLFNIVTGLYESSGGKAYVAGYDVDTQEEEVYRRIGICPQHDILWDDLNSIEHLVFYARLKGIPKSEEMEAVKNAIARVALTGLERRLAKRLSGGERRRLCIAIALVANPKVVFLDEPTTGLDVEVRRLVWSIIQESRANRTIILTTHSMEEADVLADRIAILAKGTLRCLGSVPRLKQLYGSGFRVSFTALQQDMPRARAYVESILPPEGFTVVDEFVTSMVYEFKCAMLYIATLFESMEANKDAVGIEEYGISQTTLEEVFLSIVRNDDAEAS